MIPPTPGMVFVLLLLFRGNHQVAIYDRQGNQIAVIPLPGQCTWLDWDKDGEILSITQDFGGKTDSKIHVYIWLIYNVTFAECMVCVVSVHIHK